MTAVTTRWRQYRVGRYRVAINDETGRWFFKLRRRNGPWKTRFHSTDLKRVAEFMYLRGLTGLEARCDPHRG